MAQKREFSNLKQISVPSVLSVGCNLSVKAFLVCHRKCMTFQKVNSLIGLLNEVTLFLFSSLFDVWQMPGYQRFMKYKSLPSKEALEETRSQRDPTIFAFSFLSRGSVFLSHFALFSLCKRWLLVFWDERHLFGSLQRITELWKSLVFQSCSISILYPIWRWWSKGSELWEKLKDVCFGVNNNKTNPQTHRWLSFKDCPSANAREQIYQYLKSVRGIDES